MDIIILVIPIITITAIVVYVYVYIVLLKYFPGKFLGLNIVWNMRINYSNLRWVL